MASPFVATAVRHGHGCRAPGLVRPVGVRRIPALTRDAAGPVCRREGATPRTKRARSAPRSPSVLIGSTVSFITR